MRLHGTVRADRPLLVVALDEEAGRLDGGCRADHRVGKVSRGLAVATLLASTSGRRR